MITQNMKLLLLALICAMFVGFVSVSQIIEGDQLPQVTVGHLVSHFQRPLQALMSLPLKKLQLG